MSSRDRDLSAAIARLAVAGDGVVLGIGLAAVATFSLYKLLASSAALRLISSAPSVPISDLRLLLSADGTDDSGRLVVVRGRVHPSSPRVLTAKGSDEPAVAVLSTTTCLYNEWRGILGWSFDLHALFVRSWREQRSTMFKSVPFVLIEEANWPHSAYVHVNLDKITHSLPLMKVHHQLHPVRATAFTLFQALFGHGYPVALLDEEKILKVGEEITAVGICRTQDGHVEIKSCEELPYFLSHMTKDDIVAELDFSSRILFWSSIVFGTLSVGILGYSVSRNWQKWKLWRENRRREMEELRNETHDSRTEQEDVPDGQLCVVCLSVRRTSAFIPCGHLVCCRRCAMSVERDSSPKCPVCRQTIRSSLRVYDS